MIKGRWNTIHRCSPCSSSCCPGPHSCVLTLLLVLPLPLVLPLLPFVLSWPSFVPGPCLCSSTSCSCWPSPHAYALHRPLVVLSWPLFVPGPHLCTSCSWSFALTWPSFVCSHCPALILALICVSVLALVHVFTLPCSHSHCPGPHSCAHPVLVLSCSFTMHSSGLCSCTFGLVCLYQIHS